MSSVTVLSISPFADDHRRLEAILSHSTWRLRRATTGAEALDLLSVEACPVILCESRLPDGGWEQLAETVARMHDPVARLIVTSRLADDRLWLEVLGRGGYNVLPKPFEEKDVFWVIRHAWLDWKSEQERSMGRRVAAGALTV